MLSRDPLTPGGSGVTGFNPYAYAGQNPTTYTDPSGTMTVETGTLQLPGSRTIPRWLVISARIVAILLAIVGALVGVEELLRRRTVEDTERNPRRPELRPTPFPWQPPLPTAGLRSKDPDDGCDPAQVGWVDPLPTVWLPVYEKEGATGVDARLTKSSLTQRKTNPGDPPGWVSGTDELDRAHLLAEKLGGSGERDNIVAMFRYANQRVMSRYEGQVRAAIERCEVVSYSVRVNYGAGVTCRGIHLPVESVTIWATGSNGFTLTPNPATVRNWPL
jgi:hypothetical protein